MEDIELSFNKIVNLIETRRKNAIIKVNEELIMLYLEIGEYLSNQIKVSKYGDKIIDKLAEFMKTNYSNIKGFTRSNIYRMVQFYEIYKDDEIVAPLVRQLSWTNNLIIFSRCKVSKEREFYIKLSIKNNYSKKELIRQLDSNYYERYTLSNGNARASLIKAIDEDDYPNTRILDLYSLEFLDLPNEYSEKDLKKSIIMNMKDFILEIGKDFTFVGEEYRVQVGNHDFFIDLLFYNRELSCLVAFELKIGEFKAEYVRKNGTIS